MSKEDLIKDLEIIKGFLEWAYPLHYQLVMDEAIKIIKETCDGR